MKTSVHCHIETPLTGSTVVNMVARAKELGRTHFAVTDNNHLASILKVYSLCKPDKKSNLEHMKRGLQLIPGIEVYFKDPNDALINGTEVSRCKYFTLSLFAEDQEAFQHLVKMVSRVNRPTIEIYEEIQSLWSWEDLVEISQKKVNLVLGGPHCLVGKSYLAGRPDISEKLLLKLKDIFSNKLHVSLICEPWSKKWQSIVKIDYTDGTYDSMLTSDRIKTDKARSIPAKDLINKTYHRRIESKTVGGVYSIVNKEISKATLHKGFLPLPGGDFMTRSNRLLKALANKHGITILVSDYAYMSKKEDKVVQTMRLDSNDKLQPNLFMKNEEEIFQYLTTIMGISLEEAKRLISNNDEWAKRFDGFTLKYETKLVHYDGDPLKRAMELIKKNNRMKWDDPVWVERLREEFKVIAKNPVKDFLPYFFPIIEVNEFCTENGILTGVARGSAGGSLLCYLMGVTNLNPMKYDLSFSRFLSLDRIKNGDWPDVDSDYSDKVLLFGEDSKSGYLKDKYGEGTAQIGTKSTIRLKSAIKDVNRYFHGEVQEEIEVMTKGLPVPPQGVTDHEFVFGYEDKDTGSHIQGLLELSDELKKYVEKRPQEWDLVCRALSIVRSRSIHACATILSSVPVTDIVPLRNGHVTQYEAKEVEYCGLLKYDFLKVDQLKDIELCLKLINKKNKDDLEIGKFHHNGALLNIWDLPEVEEVFKSIWGGETATIFQLHTVSMIPFVKDILPKSVDDISVILALVRPGPLDYLNEATGRNMSEEYVWRRRGDSETDFQALYDLIPETYGIIVFQEQQLKIAKELGGMPADQAEALRRLFSKKKKTEALAMKPVFMKTAVEKIGKDNAEKIWSMMETFARYSFNKSHSTAYAIISYACMFLKHYYPLEWWASVLTNAEEKEITSKFWPLVKDIVLAPDINLSGDTMVVDYDTNTIRSKLGIIRGIGEKTIDPIVNNRPYKDIQDFVNKDVAGPSLSHKLIHVGVLDSLFPKTANLIEKLKLYEEAREMKTYLEKSKEASKKGKTLRTNGPKAAKIPEEYLNITPMQEAAIKKSILTSLPIDLHALGAKYSKVKLPYINKPLVKSANDYETLLINGAQLERLEQIPGEDVRKSIYVAVTCYIIEAKEFTYAKNTKKALKVVIDTGMGNTSEKVLWPNYDTGELIYDKSLKKGVLATLFLRKKEGRKDMSIMNIVVES